MENLSDVSSNNSISPEEIMSRSLQYNNSYDTTEAIEYAANFTIVSIGLLGNGLVIYVIGRSSKMRKHKTTLFLMNQSCIDFVACILMLMWFLSTKYDQYESGIASNILCMFVSSAWPMVVGVVASTLNLVAITVERYFMVCHPVIYKKCYSRKRVLIVAIIVWLLGIFSGIPCIVSTRVVNNECHRNAFWFHPSLEKAYWLILPGLTIVGPLIFFIITYTKIYLAIHRRSKMKRNNTLHLHDPNRKYKLGPTEKNILKTMAIVSTCYFVCYLPIIVKFILAALGVMESFIAGGFINEIPRLFIYSNACVNPFIYAFKLKIFQMEFKRYFCLRGDNIRVHPSIATVTIELP